MSGSRKQFTMRMEEENFNKINEISHREKRSMAMQIEYLIEKYIENYEKEKGPIEVRPELL